MWKLIVKLIGAIIVAVAIFFSEFLPNVYSKAGLAALGAALFYFIDPVWEFGVRKKKERDLLKIVTQSVDSVGSFFKKHIGDKFNRDGYRETIKDELSDHSKDSVGHWIIYSHYNVDEHVKDGVFMLYLCSLIDGTKNDVDVSNYKRRISEVISRYDFVNPDEQAKTILRMYVNFRAGKKLNEPVDVNYGDVFNDFTKRYSKTLNFAFNMYLEKEQAEEFRKTLSILITRGKISGRQTHKDAFKKIQSKIEEHGKSTKAFLFLSNMYQYNEKVAETLDSLPHIKFGNKYTAKLPSGINYLHMRLVYPPKNNQDPEQFIASQILPHLSEEDKAKGFVSIIPMEGTEIYSYPENSAAISDDKVRQAYSAIGAIKTGENFNFADLFLDVIDADLTVENLLSIIPFNIFIPGLNDDTKTFIIDHYDEIRNHFDVEKLSDWADVTKEDLSAYLVGIDEADKVSRNRQRKTCSEENWKKHSAKIVEAAIKHRDAMG